MSDLIKREELLDYLRTIPIDLGYREMEDVVTFVEKMKSVNAAEVVRCKECVENDAQNWCWKFGYTMHDGDFCSFGERKTDG